MADYGTLFKKPTFLLKLVELLLCIICTGLIVGNFVVCRESNSMAAIYATLISYMMIGIIVILTYFLEPQLNRVLILLIDATAFIMFITAGGLMCNFYNNPPQTPWANGGKLLASGILAFFNAAVYAVDAFFTYMTHDEVSLPA